MKAEWDEEGRAGTEPHIAWHEVGSECPFTAGQVWLEGTDKLGPEAA